VVKVKVLKHVGDWNPGDVVEVSDAIAIELCDGVKAERLDRYMTAEAVRRDINNLTVKEMRELGMDNKPLSPDQEMLVKTEEAALAGKPVAHGEPLITVGGITPATQVFPAMIDAMDENVRPEVTKGEDLKAEAKAKESDKKADDKADKKAKK
jgi:hypothetical protein